MFLLYLTSCKEQELATSERNASRRNDTDMPREEDMIQAEKFLSRHSQKNSNSARHAAIVQENEHEEWER